MGPLGGSEKNEQNPEKALVDFLLQAGEKLSPKRVKEIADLVAKYGNNARAVLGDAGSVEPTKSEEKDHDAELARERSYEPSNDLRRVIESFIREPNFHIARDIAKRMVRF